MIANVNSVAQVIGFIRMQKRKKKYVLWCYCYNADLPFSISETETHRTVLNQILRQSTTHLADGPFAVLVDYTRILDFDVKRK